MTGEKGHTWDEIRSLIERADKVRRESEYLRAQVERAWRRPDIWPERRQPARTHANEDSKGRHKERESPQGGEKQTP